MDALKIEKYEQRILRRERSYKRAKWAAIGLAILLVVLTAGAIIIGRVLLPDALLEDPSLTPEARAIITDARESEKELYGPSSPLVMTLWFCVFAVAYAQAKICHAQSIRFHRGKTDEGNS